jgi:hypothetical protein
MAQKLIFTKDIESAVWTRAWCAVASSIGCKDTGVAAKWADACLYEFKQRFRKDFEMKEKHE